MKAKDFPVPMPSGEETVVGVHASGVQLEEGLNTNNSRYYCGNCTKKIHCYVKIDKDTHEAVIHKTCKNDDCECKCRTHFACKKCGYLHPYGMKCDRDNDDNKKIDKKAEKEFQKLMDKWNKSKKVEVMVQKKK